MEMVAPVGPMYQAGTLSGNPLAMSAGIAALELLKTPGTWERLEKASADLMSGIAAAAVAAGIPIQQTRVGTMFTTFFSEVPPVDWSTVKVADKVRYGQFFRKMLECGVYLAPSAFEAGFMSTAHTDTDIKATVAAAEESNHGS
jgi:glutamate-1-semialdehyde 2,1-aminomutase